MQALPSSQLSWRDPDGFVIKFEERIFRAVRLEKGPQTIELLREPWMIQLVSEGVVPQTQELTKPPRIMQNMDRWLWLEHAALPFPCHPHEITALQLYDSGRLTLRIALAAAVHGWTLKDASAWNVLFSGGRPTFVDMLSFDRSEPSRGWVAYGQFARHFLLPLLLYGKLGITPSEIFLTNRDGIHPERAYELLRGLKLISFAALELVILPKLLAPAGGRLIAAESAKAPKAVSPAMGREAVLGTLRRLQRSLERLEPDHSKTDSVWKDYEEDRLHYSEVDLVAKKKFVTENLAQYSKLLDLGCNAGEFSLLAAESGRTVVAADFDHPALSRLYSRIRGKSTGISPLLVNIGRPTPAIGWENSEVASFLARSAGYFDCILALGLIHHLLVSERATLPMVVDLLDRLRPKSVILEWVDPTDPKFRQLAGLNGALYADLNPSQLEESFRVKFRLVKKLALPCATRVMYLWNR